MIVLAWFLIAASAIAFAFIDRAHVRSRQKGERDEDTMRVLRSHGCWARRDVDRSGRTQYPQVAHAAGRMSSATSGTPHYPLLVHQHCSTVDHARAYLAHDADTERAIAAFLGTHRSR